MNGERIESEDRYESDREQRADTSPELILELNRPTVKQGHKKFISKDLSLSNIPRSMADTKITLWKRYISLMLDFDFLGLPKMADIYNAEMKGEINLFRSINGFERRIQKTAIGRSESNTSEQSGGRFGLRKS